MKVAAKGDDIASDILQTIEPLYAVMKVCQPQNSQSFTH
jgi:hypothetical protein